MKSDQHKKVAENGRMSPRVHTVDKISVNYEGKTEEVADRLPDVSPRGMFIGTSQRFPEGAVLNLKFRLAITGAEIGTRGEVRYCQPGVGVGVEFVDISPEDMRAIEHEVELCAKERAKRTVRKKLLRAR
jgi:PilZ domain